jgi:S-adenosylmethionine synthetase
MTPVGAVHAANGAVMDEWNVTRLPPHEDSIEIVEQKGIGHPDTLCDALAEGPSASLCRWSLERFGRILHHNVDKALRVGGQVRVCPGGEEVLVPRSRAFRACGE